MIVPLDLDDERTGGAVLALQRAAYAVEAELVGSDDIPGLRESLDELRATTEHFVGIFDGDVLVAALSYVETDELLDVCRLVVAPASSRRGLGERLIRWALESVARPVTVVSTGSANAPAVALYAKLGFTGLRDEEVVPGLSVTHFELRR